jgi:hypothetical protein
LLLAAAYPPDAAAAMPFPVKRPFLVAAAAKAG